VSAPFVLARCEAAADVEVRAAALRSAVLDAVEGTLAYDERIRGVLHRTYVEPADKQLAAASDLGLSFATFRRLLGSGVEFVIATLWEEDLAAASRR
jgi:hypothetical protein